MAVNGQLQSAFDPSYQEVVTSQCNVPPTYATAGGAFDFQYVNNDMSFVSASDGQPCLEMYLGVAEPSWIQEPQIFEQPPPLIYGQPPFQTCNFPEAEQSYRSDSRATIPKEAQYHQGELYKTASKTA